MSQHPRIPPPAGLGLPGKRVWRRITKPWELRADELIILENAARTADIIANLDAAMVDQPLIVAGSMGQLREHPLLTEARQQRALLARLLAQLKLPDDAEHVRASRTITARAAANARWHGRTSGA